jgi:uncharacterized protein (DUF58 family)
LEFIQLLTVEEIQKKVKQLEIKSKKLTANLFTGEYHTAFKGRGMVFKEVREYTAGDDIRFMDWNVSARMGHPYSKVFEEERELTVIFLIDISQSNFLGNKGKTKQDIITEISAVLAFSAMNNRDKIGALFFTNVVEQFIPPKKGKEHILYMVRQMLSIQPKKTETDIGEALKFLNQTVGQKSIVFLVSDFISNDYTKPLKATATKHDCIAIHVYDKLETNLPNAGLIPLADAETGEVIWVDTNDAHFKKAYPLLLKEKAKTLKDTMKKAGVELLDFNTLDDFVPVLQHFFLKRIKHR